MPKIEIELTDEELASLCLYAARDGMRPEEWLNDEAHDIVVCEYWEIEARKYDGAAEYIHRPSAPEDLSKYPTVKGPRDGWRREDVTWLRPRGECCHDEDRGRADG